MPLPDFDSEGDLPEGLHPVSLADFLARFGTGSPQRQLVSARLVRIRGLAQATGKLDRFIIFGSYVTLKPEPNDIDIVLVMRDDFDLHVCTGETRKLFDHRQAAEEFGASIFWVGPSQVKHDKTRRGIVEVKP